MLIDLRKALLAGFLLFLLGLVNGGPARALTSERDITDDAITDEDTVEFDGIYDEGSDDGSSGVLGRLWTGFSSRLNLFGDGEFEKKLQRFRSKVVQSLRDDVNELTEIRKRRKRSHPIESILSRDSKGFHRLSGLDTNVNEYLKTFTSPVNAISMEVFEHLNFIIWLVTEDYSVDNSGYLYVYMLDVAHNTLQKTQILTLGAKKCVPVLKLNVFIEIVCVETLSQDVPDSLRKGPGSGVYRITWSEGLKVEFIRALKTQTAQDVALWVIGESTFIAFANSYDPIRRSGELLSDVFQLQITAQNGVIYPSYDRLDNAGFSTKYAYGLESFNIISRHFLAVANHKDDIGNVEIDSVIYVYDLHRKTLNPFQRIRTSGARDWTAFSFTEGASSEYFLAVANEYKIDKSGNKDFEVDSVIYKYDNGKFVPFQCIKTNGARQWVVYQGSQGEFLMAVVNGQSGVFFYQYNGWRFVQTSFSVSGLGAVSASFSYLSITLNKLLFTVANPFDLTANKPLTYYVSFEYQNPLGKYYDDALAWCRALSNTIANDGLDDLVRRVQQATKVDGAKNFTSAVTIRGNLRVTAEFTSIFNIVVLSQGIRFDLGIQALTDLKVKLEEARQRVNLLKQLLQEAKMIHSQLVYDGMRFSKIRIICSSDSANRCLVNNLIANTVNGISASFENVIRIDQEYNIQSLKLTDLAVTQGGQITVDFISGPGLPRTPFSEIVTLTGNHNIIGRKTFGKLQANFLVVSGTVGGIRISRDNLLLTVTEQRITTEVTFQSLRVESIIVNNVNGRDFSSLLNNLVLKGATQTFTGPLIIRGDLIAPSIITVNPVTPLDPVTASKSVLLYNTGETQIITGSHTVAGLNALQGITVEGLLNGLSVPDDFYLRTSNEILNRPVTFQDVVADMVTIGSMIGDVQVVNGELDLLLLNGDQVVSGQKTFNEITLLGQSTVAGTISGYRLEDFTSNLSADIIRGINSGQRIIGKVTFENRLTILDDLLDGVSISRILNLAISLNATRIENEVIFEGPVQIDGDLTVTEKLNGVNIGDYVLKDGTYTLTGDIIFTTDLVVKDNVEADTVNGYDLSSLASRLVLIDGDQTITGDITFHSPEFLDLSVSGEVVVNGINLNDFVTVNSNAVITGEKTFTTLRVLSSVRAGAVDVGQFGQVDGVVINDLFFADSLRKTATSVQNLVGRELNVVIAESVSGTNLASLQRRVIYKDRPTNINGSLTFTGPVTVWDLTFSGTFDGVSAEDYNSGWLQKTGTQTLTGRNTFFNLNTGDVSFTGGSIQGVDLNQLLKNTAKTDEATTLGGISFDEIVSASPVSLDGRIQGIKLRDEALLSNGVNQVVTGEKTFRGKVSYSGRFTIDGNVEVRNNPNDVPVSIDVGGLCNAGVITGSEINLQEVTVDGDVVIGGNVNVTGSINDQSVVDLANTYWLSDTPNYVPSVTRFAEVEIVSNANLILEGLINGVDIRAVWEDLLRKECDQQTITGEYFIENLNVDSLETDRITNSDDNLRLNLLKHVLLKEGNQRITGLFTFSKLETRDSVILDGTLNNLRVDTDYAQYNKPAVITARKTFESLTVNGDLIVEDGVTIQGVDVSELAKTAIKPGNDGSGNCFIPGTTTFQDLRLEDGSLEVGGTVDGVTLDASRVLLKSSDQRILGRVVFSGQNGLEIIDNLQVLDGKFNEIDLSRLRDLTVRNDGPIVISGAITFATSATFTTVIISNHLINGYNVTDLGLCLSGKHVVNNMGDQFAFVLKAARDARDMLSEKATELWYFIETDLSPVDKLMPVSLGTNFLSSHKYDMLAGLDLRADLVYTYRIEMNFPLAFTPIPVVGPSAVAGLSQNLLATCGKGQMSAIQSGYSSTSYFNKIPLQSGDVHSFGHIYSVAGGLLVEAAFGIYHCRDLVSFRLNDGRLCLAVVDHAASSTILCRNAANRFSLMNYLGTNRATKGAWMDLGYRTYLLIVEEATGYVPGNLKVFTHDSSVDQMVLVTKVEVPGADDVDVIIQGMGAVIAVTKREQKLLHSSVTILTAYIENHILQIETLQTLHIREIHHCSFSLMPSGEVGLFIQTFYGIKLYLWKCVEFVYAREIKTEAAVWPTSEAFLYEHDNVSSLLVAFSASGALDPLTKEHDFDIIKTKLYTAQYRGSKVVIPRYLQ